MTFLADLSDLQQDFLPDFQSCADGERWQINTFDCEIFREIPMINIQALCSDLFNTFLGQQTDLPDTGLRMGVIFEAEVLDE